MHNFSLIKGWEKLPDYKRNPVLASTLSIHPENSTFDLKRRYSLEAKLGINFSCTPAELDFAITKAKYILSKSIYGELKSLVHSCIHEIYLGEDERATQLLNAMLEYMSIPEDFPSR